ncbi:Ca2+-binding RTX toxin-like protein [Rubricella aquisinus]|uniref:Ca2+-binding RTX toxin-like protein n=1 Tax=Rubricella aquisinus TaxID=2028108 RepID=A0A840X1N9_9RHOB|nr:hypothetical protein [Rubricella aquisinus]MBB5516684.1 Ca2+-binding RTX toxin-like protein [Rubricella aquisinus]
MLSHLWTLWDSEDTLLAAPEGVLFSELPGGGLSLLVASRGEEGFGRLTLSPDGQIADADWSADPLARGVDGLTRVDGLGQVSLGRDTGLIDTGALLRDMGIEGRLAAITATIGGDWVVSAASGQSGLALHRWDGSALGLHARIADSGLLPLGDVVALDALETARKSLIFAISAVDGGIVSYHVTDHGDARLRDVETPGGDFPAWLPTVLTTAEVDGRDFVIVGASGSNTISVFEVRERGGLVHRETLTDTHDTRFAGIDVLEQAVIGGRTVLVAAGADHGLTLLELHHDGGLSLLDVIWDDHDTALTDPSAIALMPGEVLRIAVTDRVEGAVSVYTLELSPVHARLVGDRAPDTITGGAQNDVIDGRGGRDVLEGGAGDDFLTDGRARDILTGGDGVDTFIFHRDNATDRITDFQDGLDRIDLRDYGLAGFDALDIRPNRDGANIFIGAEKLVVDSWDGKRLRLEDWGADDFLF